MEKVLVPIVVVLNCSGSQLFWSQLFWFSRQWQFGDTIGPPSSLAALCVCGQSTPLVVSSMKISFEVHEICWHGVSTVAGSMEQKSKVNSILSDAVASCTVASSLLAQHGMQQSMAVCDSVWQYHGF